MDPPRGKLIKQYYKPGRASPAGIEHSLFAFSRVFPIFTPEVLLRTYRAEDLHHLPLPSD